jgi:hypothetical protein
MSEHARKWLDEWVSTNVSSATFAQQKRQAVEMYGPNCLTEAMKVGITRRELERAADGNLLDFLESAIEDKMDIQVRRNRPAA